MKNGGGGHDFVERVDVENSKDREFEIFDRVPLIVRVLTGASREHI